MTGLPRNSSTFGALGLGLLLAHGPGEGLSNGDFEAKPGRDDPVPGWTLSVGVLNGAEEPVSEVEVDRKVRRSGRRSLRFSADRSTFAFQIVGQEVEARPGATYRLTGFARTKNVRHEVNAKGIHQFDNCYLALFLFDGNGEVVARGVKAPTRPYTDDWEAVSLRVEAPDSVRRAEVKLFLSVSGELWFDDLELTIEGGAEVPAPVVVFREDFEELAELPPMWLVREGARNGGTTPTSTIEVDRGRDRSLRLAGDEETLLWNGVDRYFEAVPGDVFALSARVRAKGVGPEVNVLGNRQFENFHLRLVFFDEDGNTVGAPRYAHPGAGDYAWRPVSVTASAPEGAARGMAGIFLSMSGEAWIDDVELTRQTGGAPAYADWEAFETERLLVRHPPDHPLGERLAAYGARMEEALTRIASELRVEVTEPITVFLYRDHAQGEALTGRPLAYAEAERRAVHQDATNTPGHELAHVVALRMGYAGTGLLGEGVAVWLDGMPPELHHDRAAELLRGGELPAMRDLLGDFRGQAHGYPAAGSFCGWLLETHGLEAFRRLYPREDLEAAARSVLGSDMARLDGAWRAFLKGRD